MVHCVGRLIAEGKTGVIRSGFETMAGVRRVRRSRFAVANLSRRDKPAGSLGFESTSGGFSIYAIQIDYD